MSDSWSESDPSGDTDWLFDSDEEEQAVVSSAADQGLNSSSASDSPEEADDMSDSWSDGYSSCDEEQVSYQISDEDYDSNEDQASISD
eukprot:15166041-Ditylum_brightwellii.AAC.1